MAAGMDVAQHLASYATIAQSKIDLHAQAVEQQQQPPQDTPPSHKDPVSSRTSFRVGAIFVFALRGRAGVGGSSSSRKSSEDATKTSQEGEQGVDPHALAWGSALNGAFATQGGSEGDFLNRVAALMQDPHIVAAFARFDSERKGVVPNERIEAILYEMGSQLNDGEMRTLLTKLDVNGDGEVDLWELCRFLVSRHDEIVGELDETWAMEEAFNLFATDNSGKVTVSELRRIFCMSNGVDLHGIDEADFHRMLREMGVTSSPGKARATGEDATAGSPPREELTRRRGRRTRMSANSIVSEQDEGPEQTVSLDVLRKHPAFTGGGRM